MTAMLPLPPGDPIALRRQAQEIDEAANGVSQSSSGVEAGVEQAIRGWTGGAEAVFSALGTRTETMLEALAASLRIYAIAVREYATVLETCQARVSAAQVRLDQASAAVDPGVIVPGIIAEADRERQYASRAAAEMANIARTLSAMWGEVFPHATEQQCSLVSRVNTASLGVADGLGARAIGSTPGNPVQMASLVGLGLAAWATGVTSPTTIPLSPAAGSLDAGIGGTSAPWTLVTTAGQSTSSSDLLAAINGNAGVFAPAWTQGSSPLAPTATLGGTVPEPISMVPGPSGPVGGTWVVRPEAAAPIGITLVPRSDVAVAGLIPGVPLFGPSVFHGIAANNAVTTLQAAGLSVFYPSSGALGPIL